jgi:hypothetical protein
MTMAYILGRYRVPSYPAWRSVLEEKRLMLRDLGVTSLHVFRNERDPETVQLLFEGPNAEQLRTVWDSGAVREWRHDAGSLQEGLFVEDP